MNQKLNCVLFIDDDEPTNFLNQLVIENVNCSEHVQIATSGEQALRYLGNSKNCAPANSNYPCPDLIFLDINMPAMNGWEFLKEYNELEKEQKGNIVIIMLTTSLNPDDIIKAKDTPHITGFENKPLTEEKLARLLEKYFPQHQQQLPVDQASIPIR
ncbi:MAG: response regulator [Bacteroidota bacterium]